MDEDYKQSDISKEVERLMDEEGFEFGEAVKEAMSKGYKDGGLMIAIQKLAQGGMTYGDKTYHQYHDQYVPPDTEAMGYANGGGIGSMMIPKRQGFFMGGSPLTGEALNIYTSMNAYGYTDQEIADRLSGLGLYTPDSGTPPPPDTTPPGGGSDGGGGGGGGGGAADPTITKKTRDKNIDLGIAAAEADKGDLMLDEIISKTTPGLEIPDRNRGMEDNEDFIDRGNPKNDPRIVSEEMGLVGFKDIPDRNRGMEVNENFIDRGDPMNDIRVVSEEMGLVGGIPDRNRGQITPNTIGGITTIDRPNMRDIAGPSTTVDESISIEDLSKPSNIGDFQITGAPDLANLTGILNAPPSIGFAQDPEGVEDPFGGKYTPSFEEKKAAEGILAGLLEKAADFNLSDLKGMGTNLSINKALQTLGFANIPSFLGTKAITSGIDYFKNKQVQKEIEKQAAATQNRKETRDLQNRIDRGEFNTSKDDRNRSTVTKESASKTKGVGGGGYTKSDDNRESQRGNPGGSKSKSSSPTNVGNPFGYR